MAAVYFIDELDVGEAQTEKGKLKNKEMVTMKDPTQRIHDLLSLVLDAKTTAQTLKTLSFGGYESRHEEVIPILKFRKRLAALKCLSDGWGVMKQEVKIEV